jgi:MFS family permease
MTLQKVNESSRAKVYSLGRDYKTIYKLTAQITQRSGSIFLALPDPAKDKMSIESKGENGPESGEEIDETSIEVTSSHNVEMSTRSGRGLNEQNKSNRWQDDDGTASSSSSSSSDSEMDIMEIEEPANDVNVSRSRTVAIITSITGITAISSFLVGLLTVGIPVISRDLDIAPELQLWPMAAFGVACGCALLPCGAVADILGCRKMCLLGGFLQACSTVGAGLSKSATQLIAIRILAGIATSLTLPGAVGVTADAFPSNAHPRRRSAAFASMAGGQSMGFGTGLAIGGVFADSIGWRWGFYTVAMLNGLTLILALWALPSAVDRPLTLDSFKRLGREVDWVGAAIISTGLAFLSYVLGVTTGSGAKQELRKPYNIALLCVGVSLFPVFAFWMRRQVRLGRPALIPNSLWTTNLPFTAVCIAVFLLYGILNASEQLATLYFQDVRELSALTSSLYFLPAAVMAILMNCFVGTFLPYLRPSIAVPFSCLVSAIGPLLLATLSKTNGPGYWQGMFQAMVLNPIGQQIIYTVGNLIMTAAFPTKTQALAGGVFNMLAEIGRSVGVSTTAVIARQVTSQSHVQHSTAQESLLVGYKAGWWYNTALAFCSVAISFWGLRHVHKLGVKNE